MATEFFRSSGRHPLDAEVDEWYLQLAADHLADQRVARSVADDVDRVDLVIRQLGPDHPIGTFDRPTKFLADLDIDLLAVQLGLVDGIRDPVVVDPPAVDLLEVVGQSDVVTGLDELDRARVAGAQGDLVQFSELPKSRGRFSRRMALLDNVLSASYFVGTAASISRLARSRKAGNSSAWPGNSGPPRTSPSPLAILALSARNAATVMSSPPKVRCPVRPSTSIPSRPSRLPSFDFVY